LQLSYYEKNIREKQISLNEYEEVFKKSDFKILLGRLTSWSMLYLKQHLRRNVSTRSSFSAETYRDEFDRFIKRFPIIGSSTHSIINSIGKGALLD
ncbi:DNA helicase, partial [Escherichia coli]|nr:DNA helicase [Escherichia coli]